MRDIAQIIASCPYEINEEVEYDNWNGGTAGHDVIFLLTDDQMDRIPLEGQSEIQSRVAQDLNRASGSLRNEFVSDVFFEYADDFIQSNRNSESSQAASPVLDTPPFWKPGTVRLFLSHRDTWKEKAHALATALEDYGVSSFVAHDDIEPDNDWQREIERALRSMDILLACITDDFFSSPWTSQEIGYAIGQDIPVVSLKMQAQDPVGFIRNRQAAKVVRGDVRATAKSVFSTLTKRLSGNANLRTAIVSRFKSAYSYDNAREMFDYLLDIQSLTHEEIADLVEAYNTNNQLSGSFAVNAGMLDFANSRSNIDYKLTSDGKIIPASQLDDDIPF